MVSLKLAAYVILSPSEKDEETYLPFVILSASEESGVGECLLARCFTEFILRYEGFSMTDRIANYSTD